MQQVFDVRHNILDFATLICYYLPESYYIYGVSAR